MNDAILQRIQPVVLVGGQSKRFGRDKLREPMGASGERWLVDFPIAALRAVFGARVALVGECHPDVAARGDFVIEDRYPGVGPAGGILSALDFCASDGEMRDVFVLAGDLPHITDATVRRIVEECARLDTIFSSQPDHDLQQGMGAPQLILADSHGAQPCIGVYRQAVRANLASRVQQVRLSLHDVVDPGMRRLVSVDAREAMNLNTPPT